MYKTARSVFSILLISIIAVMSCKKSKTSTAADNLPGTWKLTKEYPDFNNNGVMDDSEIIPSVDIVYVFVSDGTYSTSIQGALVNKGHWKLIDNNTYLQITDTTVTGVNNMYNLIESISNTTLEVKDTLHAASGGTTWLYFTKQ